MMKVVLLDNDEFVRNFLKQEVNWEKYGCEVVASVSAAVRGVAAVHEHSADILILDAVMPGADGLRVAEVLQEEYPLLQIVILTKVQDFMYAQRAINAGVARYLLKPPKLHELYDALAAVTERLRRTSVTAEPEVETEDDPPRVSSFIVRNALAYIEEHYMERITLQQVAEHTFVSQWYLSKLLKRHVGDSFADTLHKARIAVAKDLLRDPALRIHEISDKVGYTDAAHFSKVFKRLTNKTPGEFRNN
ncbi:response regulator transcription factor [Clostridia bacterium]|nr:response regulator transcription factor [Clostridia bacterium]